MADTAAAPAALDYASPSAGIDTGTYDVSHTRGFAEDPVAHASVADLADLSSSPHWEDRVRAEVLRKVVTITLPDEFPCLYETADSPNRAGHLHPKPHPWVLSPDIDMLHDLLPDYQELWDSYTSQWGPESRRVFAVGRLNGLTPHGVYRPGTTPAQVIGSTMLTHSRMYQRAPQRLREMHPQFESWTRETQRTTA